MSVHRRFLSILAEAVSKFDTIPAGPVEMLAELQRDKDAVRSEILHMLDRYAAKHYIPSDDEERRRLCGYVEALVGELFFGIEEELHLLEREEELDLFDTEDEFDLFDGEEELDREVEPSPGHYWAMSSIVT
jgi:hypothetical protein